MCDGACKASGAGLEIKGFVEAEATASVVSC